MITVDLELTALEAAALRGIEELRMALDRQEQEWHRVIEARLQLQPGAIARCYTPAGETLCSRPARVSPQKFT